MNYPPVLDTLKDELTPKEGSIQVKKVSSYDQIWGPYFFGFDLVESVPARSGAFKKLRAKRTTILQLAQDHVANSGYAYAETDEAFRVAKEHFLELQETFRTEPRFSEDYAEKFHITNRSFNSRTEEYLHRLAKELNATVRIHTAYERDGLQTVAPFANVYSIVRNDVTLGKMTNLFYTPGGAPYHGKFEPSWTLLISSQDIADLLIDTARKISIDHAQNGRYPIDTAATQVCIEPGYVQGTEVIRN